MSTKFLRSFALAALLTLGFGLSACKNAGDKAQEWLQNLTQTGSPRSSNDPVLAKVGSEEIRGSDFINYLRFRPDLKQREMTPEGRVQILRGIVYEVTVSQLARKAGIPRDPSYRESMKQNEEMQLMKFYTDRMRSEITVSSADVRAYYDTHPQEFTEGIIHASHIVMKTSEEAEEALGQIGKGVSFDSVAKDFSIDKNSAKAGGKMPPVRTSQLSPEFERAFIALNPGQISGITKTPEGFELIRKNAETLGPLKPFDDVQDSIRAKLANQALGRRVNQEETSVPVIINEDQVKSLNIPAK